MKTIKSLFYFLFLFWPLAILAQTPPPAPASPIIDNLEKFGDNAHLGKQSLVTTIAGIVNTALLLLGTIFVVLIIYGGFKWMTSRGNATELEEAKKLIGNATIGLSIILAAYAISKFVIAGLYNATRGLPPESN